ncbi:MAG: MnhB domain-containing protein [Bacillota bacterium]
MDDLVLQTVVKILIPFIQTFALAVIFNGHLSPGGGFAGGTVLGSSIILYALAFHVDEALRHYPRQNAKVLESLGVVTFSAVGLYALARGGNFLSNRPFFTLGQTGNLFSGGMVLLIMVAIGVKVASTMVTLFFHLLEEKKL